MEALCIMRACELQFDDLLGSYVATAREERHTWEEIAAALGVTRQAATKRFGWVDEVDDSPDEEP